MQLFKLVGMMQRSLRASIAVVLIFGFILKFFSPSCWEYNLTVHNISRGVISDFSWGRDGLASEASLISRGVRGGGGGGL